MKIVKPEKETIFMITLLILSFLLLYSEFHFWIIPDNKAAIEKEIYKCTALIDEKAFEGVTNKAEDGQILTVYPNTEYPGDKIVVINNKSVGELWVYVENNDGLAKVMDVELDGKQVSFR